MPTIDINQPGQTHSPQLISIMVERNEDGYLARVPAIQGAFAEGDTPQEAIFNCLDILSLIIDYRKQKDQPLNLNKSEITLGEAITITIPVQL